MIFINFSLRSSRVTGPKIRVPIGARLVFKRTVGFRVNEDGTKVRVFKSTGKEVGA